MYLLFKISEPLIIINAHRAAKDLLYSRCHGTAINDAQRTENYHFGCVQSSKLVNKPAVSAMDDLNQQG